MEDRQVENATRGGWAAVAALHWAAVFSLAGAFLGAGLTLLSGLM